MARVVGASTAPPQAPPSTRVRSAARGRLGLATEAVVCFYHAALWACAAAAAALIATRRACGKDFRAAAVAEVNFVASVSAMTLLHLSSLLLYPWSRGILTTNDAEKLLIGGGGDDAKGPATQRRRHDKSTGGGARGRQNARHISVSGISGCVILVSCVLLIPILVMLVLVPAKGSWMEWVGSMLCDTGLLLQRVTYCFLKFPAVLDELRATCAKLKRGSRGLH